ncbi:MAG: M23 family metallopeptidase [Gemmatimonadota bacterium]|jgi:murein DD-endopeptidase MepM/ murein hydrolase activator NlpD
MLRARALAAVLLASALLAGCTVPRWPVDGRLTSPYGLRQGGGLLPDIHRGVDIAVPTGTPVRAMAPGRVAYAGTMSGYGRVVIVDHGGGTRTIYAHLSEVRVASGQELEGRAVIGLSGSSGRATAPHLHFEVLRRGRAEDPVPLLGGAPGSGRPRSP